MLVICHGPGCGKEFETSSSKARFCGSTCRVRAHRNGEVITLPETASKAAPEASTALLDATSAELEAAGVTETALGQQALELARRMSDPRAMGLSVAPISKELRQVMLDAKREAPRASGLDELRARRDHKRNAG